MKQGLRSRFLNFLKHYFNPLTKRIARTRFSPFAIVRHTGRKSGKQYETPIVVRPIKDSFVIELTYGPDVDWYKNVVAANGCTIIWHGKEYAINGVAPLDTETGLAAFPLIVRMFLRLAHRTHYAKLLLANREST